MALMSDSRRTACQSCRHRVFYERSSRFLLAQCEGLTHKQIAEQMGLSLRSVERYVADALYHCYVLRYDS